MQFITSKDTVRRKEGQQCEVPAQRRKEIWAWLHISFTRLSQSLPVHSSLFLMGRGCYAKMDKAEAFPMSPLLHQFWLCFHMIHTAQPLLVLLQSLLREWLCHLSSLISGHKVITTLVHDISLNSIQATSPCPSSVQKRNWLFDPPQP